MGMEIPQTVKVLFYRNDFTLSERNEIKLAFQDWEIAANKNCASVHFTGFTEDGTPPFQGQTLNTHYVFRADPAPGYAASTTNHGTGVGLRESYAYTQFHHLTTAYNGYNLRSTMRHELGHTFDLADSYNASPSLTVMSA